MCYFSNCFKYRYSLAVGSRNGLQVVEGIILGKVWHMNVHTGDEEAPFCFCLILA